MQPTFLPRRFSAEVPARWGRRLLLLLALLLYVGTLDTGLAPMELEGGDLITHQYAQVQARPGNAPGYPLYTMGGWLWFHGGRFLWTNLSGTQPNPLPILSSYSTLWALISLWLLYQIICRLSISRSWPAGNWLLAWGLSAFYALTYFFWYYATTTEQYSSAIAQTLGMVYVYLLWVEEVGNPAGATTTSKFVTSPGPREKPLTRRGQSLLLGLAFLCGLSLAHMVTVAFLVPALVSLVLWERPDLLRRPIVILKAVAAAALPLISYVYIYLRGGAHPEWWGQGEWASAQEWFWAFLSTAQGREELSWGLQPGVPFFGNGFPELIWRELSIPVLLLGLIGLAFLGRRLAFLLFSTLGVYLIFCWVDRYGNWFQVILPAYPLVLLGLVGLFQTIDTRFIPRIWVGANRPLWWPWLTLLFFAILLIWRFQASWPEANSRNRVGDSALERPAYLLAQPLPPGSLVFAQVDDALGIRYLNAIWGVRPDIQSVSNRQADSLLAEGKPIYVTGDAAPLLLSELRQAEAPTLDSAGPEWVVLHHGDLCAGPNSEELCPICPCTTTRHTAQLVGDGIRLAGYEMKPLMDEMAAAELAVTLYWQREPGSHPQPWSISVRPVAEGAYVYAPDGALLQVDRPGPVQGLLAFDQLSSQFVTADSYRLSLTPGQSVDGVAILLYRPVAGGFKNLTEIRLPMD